MSAVVFRPTSSPSTRLRTSTCLYWRGSHGSRVIPGGRVSARPRGGSPAGDSQGLGVTGSTRLTGCYGERGTLRRSLAAYWEHVAASRELDEGEGLVSGERLVLWRVRASVSRRARG